MWVEVIFCTYYYLYNSTYRCDNNCQVYGETLKCYVEKHFSVLFGKTLKCFAKQFISVFNLLGLFVENNFRKDTNFLKNEMGNSNISDFKKI